MESVLLISSTDKANELLEKLLQTNGYNKVSTVKSGSEARRLIINCDFDMIVINAPLSDEIGTDLAVNLTSNTNAGVVLLVKNEIAQDISAKVEKYGVVTITKPLNKTYFYQALKLVSATRNRLLRLDKENKKLKSKLDEIKLINRAKCLLIEKGSMTEAQAHRHIEKQAMDTRNTKKEIALEIIDTYEDDF